MATLYGCPDVTLPELAIGDCHRCGYGWRIDLEYHKGVGREFDNRLHLLCSCGEHLCLRIINRESA